MAELVMLADR